MRQKSQMQGHTLLSLHPMLSYNHKNINAVAPKDGGK